MELTEKQKETLKRNNEGSRYVTREAIRDALYLLMKDKDFDEIRISEIITRSGVSRSAFYRNYKTKEEILYDTIDEIYDSFLSKASESLQHNWELIFSIFRENKLKLDLIFKAGLEHLVLEKFNQNLDMQGGKDFKAAMNNGLIVNVLLYWAKCGMKGSDKEAADLVIRSYDEICQDLQSWKR